MDTNSCLNMNFDSLNMNFDSLNPHMSPGSRIVDIFFDYSQDYNNTAFVIADVGTKNNIATTTFCTSYTLVP